MKVAEYVIDFLAGKGIGHVFLVPGGAAMHLNDALARSNRITYVANLHEQGCAVAAEAYARVTNHLGVAMVTAGPGGTNAITGLAGAWLDSTPMLFISGQVKRADLRQDPQLRQRGVQEIDIVSIVRPITKYAVTVTEPESIRYHLEKAYYLATTSRKGPVWIDLPLDVQATQIEPESCPSFTPPAEIETAAGGNLPALVQRAMAILRSAERPVLLLGNGIRSAGAVPILASFLRSLPAPLLTTWLGLDLVPQADPLFFGRPGGIASRGANFAIQNSDCLLVIGARLDPMVTGYAQDKFARGARKIVVDVDEAEIRKLSCVIECPVVTDAAAFFREWERQSTEWKAPEWEPWIARCRLWKKRYPLPLPDQEESLPLSMYRFAHELSRALSEDELIVPGSSGFACEIFFLMLEVKQGQRIFHNRGTGSMGFAVPAALGAAVASRKRVVSLEGDGGFQMNAQELAVIAGLRLPVTLFVINNRGYASIRSSQDNHFQGRHMASSPETGLHLASVHGLADAYGIPYRLIQGNRDLAESIDSVLKIEGPVICEVLVRQDEERVPRLATTVKNDGAVVSRPLEDLYPFLDRDEFLENMIVPPLSESLLD